MEEKMAWKLKKKKMKLNKNHILDLFISVPIRDIKKKIHNVVLQVSVSYSSKCRLCTSNFTKTVSIRKWSNTLFRFLSENMSYPPPPPPPPPPCL